MGHDQGHRCLPLERTVPFKMKVVSMDGGKMFEYVEERRWRSSCLMISISSKRE